MHNSTEKNKKNMKGWDYLQPREHEYLQTGSTAKKIISINLHTSKLIFNYLPGL